MAREITFPEARKPVAPRTVLVIAALGVFMAFIDSTIVTIAFPNLRASFPDSSLSSLSWVFNVYNVALAALLIPAGRLADIAGRRRLFVLGVALFTIASVLCAAAPSVGFLVAARALQGAGAAVLIPTSLGLILHAYPEKRRTHAIALWSATGALAAGIGPSIGGLLVSLADWRLVFLINLPVGIAVWWFARRELVESRAPGRRALPDMAGALLLAVSIAALTLAIVQGDSWGWTDPRTIAAVVVAAIAACVLVRRSASHPSPIVDAELLRSRGANAANALTLVGSAGFFALGLANILYLMEVWGYSPFVAGLAGTPAPFVAAAAAVAVGKVVARRDPRPFIAAGAVIWAAGPLVLASRFSTDSHYLTGYLPGAVILAIGIGITFPLVGAIAVADAPGGRYAGATALNSSVRQIGAALGVAILVALVGQPSAADTEAAFDRAWLFATICFALVAIGSLAIGRVAPVAPVDEFTEGFDEAVRRPVPVSAAAPAPRPRPLPRPPAAALEGAGGPKSVLELLAEVPMFASLAPATRAALAGRTSVVALAADEWLFRQGDEGDALYVVRTGRLEIVDETPGREPVVLRELSTGSAVGELALVCESRRTASVRVRRDARLLRIGRDEFETILAESPAFSRALLRTLGEWLSSGRAEPASDRGAAATIAVVALDDAGVAARIELELGERLSELASVTLVTSDVVPEGADPGLILSELLDRAESEYCHVVLAGGVAGEGAWTRSCMRQADRVLLVLDEPPASGAAPRLGAATRRRRGASRRPRRSGNGSAARRARAPRDVSRAPRGAAVRRHRGHGAATRRARCRPRDVGRRGALLHANRRHRGTPRRRRADRSHRWHEHGRVPRRPARPGAEPRGDRRPLLRGMGAPQPRRRLPPPAYLADPWQARPRDARTEHARLDRGPATIVLLHERRPDHGEDRPHQARSARSRGRRQHGLADLRGTGRDRAHASARRRADGQPPIGGDGEGRRRAGNRRRRQRAVRTFAGPRRPARRAGARGDHLQGHAPERG